MSLIQETDLKIYRGVRETHQSNLPLQSREKTALFSTWCYHGGEAGKRKGRKKPHKDLRKKFQAQAVEWKDHKEVLESFVSNRTNIHHQALLLCGPLWSALYLWLEFPPAQAFMTDMPGWLEGHRHVRQTKRHFMVYNLVCTPLRARMMGWLLEWVLLVRQSESAMWAATKWHLSELIRLIPKPYTPCLHACAHVYTESSALHLTRVGDSFAPQKPLLLKLKWISTAFDTST